MFWLCLFIYKYRKTKDDFYNVLPKASSAFSTWWSLWRNVVEAVLGFPVFVNKMSSNPHQPMSVVCLVNAIDSCLQVLRHHWFKYNKSFLLFSLASPFISLSLSLPPSSLSLSLSLSLPPLSLSFSLSLSLSLSLFRSLLYSLLSSFYFQSLVFHFTPNIKVWHQWWWSCNRYLRIIVSQKQKRI